METVRRIDAVRSPEVHKNQTPALTEAQACRLLHAPNRSTIKGKRDFALLFCFFKTACRASALAHALVGHVERDDTAYYLKVWEKRKKPQRKALLEAAPALLEYMRAAGIEGDLEGPLFRPVAKDRKTLLREPMDRRDLWRIVKYYCRKVDIDPDRIDGHGIGVHTLRKTALTNALEHGAPLLKVQSLAGHAQVTTTQLYWAGGVRDAEDAARHIQIR
jgi:site-specific recombinase XerD